MVRRRGAVALVLSVIIMSCIAVLWRSITIPVPRFGFTYSTMYMESLGGDPRVAYTTMLNELRPSFVRIPVYWDRVAPSPGVRHWEEIDALMEASAQYGVAITLAIGYKVPRYPECHRPSWVEGLSLAEADVALHDFLDEVVARYQHSPALERWQIENEVLYPFGACPRARTDAVAREVERVRAQDDRHPIVLTVSGEQQLWTTLAPLADIIGTSVYRTALAGHKGVVVFPHGPLLYRLQAWSVWPFAHTIISELQAEPWFSGNPLDVPLVQAAHRFTPDDLRRNVTFAVQTGIPEISLWGVEWWWYLRVHGYPQLWEAAQQIMNVEL